MHRVTEGREAICGEERSGGETFDLCKSWISWNMPVFKRFNKLGEERMRAAIIP
jgi:hypothetical protein